MNIKDFEKAERAMKRIKELDSEINQIERFAGKMQIDEAKIHFDLSISVPAKEEVKAVDDDKEMFRPPTSFFEEAFRIHSGFMSEGKLTGPKFDKDIINGKNLSDSATYKILSIILSERIRIREGYIKQLAAMGVQI